MMSAPRRSAQRSAAARALADRTAPVGPLMRGGEDERVGVGFLERLDLDAFLVDRHTHDLETGRARHRNGIIVRRGILDRQPRGSRLNERLDE
jgi:hypothetical protein